MLGATRKWVCVGGVILLSRHLCQDPSWASALLAGQEKKCQVFFGLLLINLDLHLAPNCSCLLKGQMRASRSAKRNKLPKWLRYMIPSSKSRGQMCSFGSGDIFSSDSTKGRLPICPGRIEEPSGKEALQIWRWAVLSSNMYDGAAASLWQQEVLTDDGELNTSLPTLAVSWMQGDLNACFSTGRSGRHWFWWESEKI